MSEITATMCLFKITPQGDPALVNEKRFRYRSESQAKIVADEFCERHGFYNGEGFIIVLQDNTVKHRFPLLDKQYAKKNY